MASALVASVGHQAAVGGNGPAGAAASPGLAGWPGSATSPGLAGWPGSAASPGLAGWPGSAACPGLTATRARATPLKYRSANAATNAPITVGKTSSAFAV